jgi:hypothetical protein
LSDVVIDTDTGLPVLPDGFFWRVEGRTTFYGHPEKPNVRLMRTVKFTDSRVTVPGRWPWSAGVPAVQTRNEPVLVKPLPDEFTEEHIRKAALDVWDRWQVVKAREALVGDYPPKRLEINENV